MVKSKTNSEHYKWGNNCDGWHLLKTESLSVIHEKMPPGSFERSHLHLYSQQLFFILLGTATFKLGQNVFVLNANESIHVPQNSIHSIQNLSDVDLEFLVISEPKSHGDRLIIEV